MDNQNKPGNKRRQILEAALECFNEKGYGNTSINDIMKRAGVSKGGVYWHFQSKDEIYVSMMEEWYEEMWLQRVRTALAQEDGPINKLRKYGQLYCSTVDIPFLAVLPESYLGALAEHYHDRLYALYKIDDDILYDLFSEAIEKEEIKKSDIDVLVWVYTSILDGMFTQLLFNGRRDKRYIEYYQAGIDYFINSIALTD